MLLYHGTTLEAARAAREVGILTRAQAKRSNFSHVDAPSGRDRVYMTDAYAPHFSYCACCNRDVFEAAVLRVDTSMLDVDDLMPDEDYLEQMTRGRDDLPKKWTTSRRTRFYKKRAHLLSDRDQMTWEDSLAGLGTCAHLGAIPPEAITGLASWSYRGEGSMMCLAFDPTITMLNYQFRGGYYRVLMRMLFGDPCEEEVKAAEEEWPEHLRVQRMRDWMDLFGNVVTIENY